MADPSLQEIICCMGQPIAGNPTQYMMEKAFAKAGLAWRYLTLEVVPEDLGDAIRGMRAMAFRGAHIKVPHKAAVVEYLDDLSETARLTGAVNCIDRKDDRLVGENTAGKGFVQSLREVTNPAGKKVVLFGAGSVARAIAVELGLSGVLEITVVNRSAERAEQLVALLQDEVKVSATLHVLDGDYEVPQETDLLINATSIGLGDLDAQLPLAIETLRSNLIVADVVYNSPQTRLICEARERGCTTLDGLGMLVNQTSIRFNLWTGADADSVLMREAVEEFLGI